MEENKSFAPTSRYTTVFTATPKYHTFFRIGFGSVPKRIVKIIVKINSWCACKLWYIFDILWYISEEPGFPWESYMTCDDRYQTNRIYLAVNYNFRKTLRVFQKSCQTGDACGALVIRWLPGNSIGLSSSSYYWYSTNITLCLFFPFLWVKLIPKRFVESGDNSIGLSSSSNKWYSANITLCQSCLVFMSETYSKNICQIRWLPGDSIGLSSSSYYWYSTNITPCQSCTLYLSNQVIAG